MFDDQAPSAAEPPVNLPTEPADMFASLEDDPGQAAALPKMPNALDSGLLKKKTPSIIGTSPAGMDTTSPAPVAVPLATTKGPFLGKLLLIIVLIAVVIGGGYGGWQFYQKYRAGQTTTPVASQTNVATTPTTTPVSNQGVVPVTVASSTAPVAATPTSTVITNIANNAILFGQPVDSDRDGLNDDQEKTLGTDPNNADTDGDGVSDYNEVMIYHTDPLNPDSDGDGWTDGEEIQNGFDPNGPGKLVAPPAAAPTTNTATSS